MCKIKKSIGFDRMTITGKFPSGASFKYFIGRSGERIELAFSNDDKVLSEQLKTFKNFMELRPKETNIDRFDRLEKLCEGCKSGSELILKMK